MTFSWSHLVVHRVPETGPGVQVDQGGPARRLRVPVGHRDNRRLLQPQHLPEVGRELLQERLLSRPDVAEDRGQACARSRS